MQVSDRLRGVQDSTLSPFCEEGRVGRPEWVSRFEDVETDAPMIVIAQEFFDALPVHQFQ